MISDILPFRLAAGVARRHPRGPDRPPPARCERASLVARDSSSQTLPLVPREVAQLPTQRWRWSARRRMAEDHPFGRIAQIEANLESLVAELETEVDRLMARSEQLLDGEPRR